MEVFDLYTPLSYGSLIALKKRNNTHMKHKQLHKHSDQAVSELAAENRSTSTYVASYTHMCTSSTVLHKRLVSFHKLLGAKSLLLFPKPPSYDSPLAAMQMLTSGACQHPSDTHTHMSNSVLSGVSF